MVGFRYVVNRRVKSWAWRSPIPSDTEVNLRLRDRNGTEITFVGYVDDLARLLSDWQERLLILEGEILSESRMVENDYRPGLPGSSQPSQSSQPQETPNE